jgi:iron complex transport system permease protein
MKIVLDLTKLVADGRITAAQAEELKLLAARDTSFLAINILMAFGTVAVAAGILFLLPSLITSIAIAAVLVAGGLLVSYRGGPQWTILGSAIVVVGALLLVGSLCSLLEGSWSSFVLAAAIFIGCAIAIRSSLLSGLSTLALAAALGSSTGYETAAYILIVREPTVTILCFGLLAWLAYLVARHLPAAYEPLALMFSRVSLIMVNFGFWVGSLWGDDPAKSWLPPDVPAPPHVSDYVFVVVWSLGLVGVGVWAARANRRFVVNTAAAFGAIHFYTQWFERLGAEPLSITVGGLIVIAIAFALWRYNLTMIRDANAAPA